MSRATTGRVGRRSARSRTSHRRAGGASGCARAVMGKQRACAPAATSASPRHLGAGRSVLLESIVERGAVGEMIAVEAGRKRREQTDRAAEEQPPGHIIG